jgi:iron complex transport system substrate-binding protein
MKARTLGGWLLFVLATVVASAAERPQRVVSLNLTADQWLLELAEPGQIAGLTFLARSPVYCARWEEARRLPSVRSAAEEVLRLQPDLVIAGRWGARSAVAMLRRLGVRVEVLDTPEDFAGIVAEARQVGAWLGRSEAAERWVAGLEARLARVRAARPMPPVAVVGYSQNGWVSGAGSAFTRLVEEAGGRNLAVERGVGWMARVSLEELVRWQPEALVLPAVVSGAPSLGDELLAHPALARVAGRAPAIRLRTSAVDFGGPDVITTVEALAADLQAVAERRKQ